MPRVFISYTWESNAHKAWVKNLATSLRNHGIDVTLDIWNLRPGEELTPFMEHGIRSSDFVLIVCTPTYKTKSDSRKGGSGYEGSIMTAEIVTGAPRSKFVPLLRIGSWETAAPLWLLGAYYLDFHDDQRDASYTELLETLNGTRPQAPPLGTFTPLRRRTDEVLVDFPTVDTVSAPGFSAAAAPYLHDFGISVTERTPEGSEIILINNRALYEGAAVHPTTSQNFITQVRTNNIPCSFTLRLPGEFDSARFTRPALYAATESGVTHPAWRVVALDARDRTLSSQSEDLRRSFSDIEARTYRLDAPGFDGITALRFESDPTLNGRPFAGFSALLIERLTLSRQEK